jgi:hypothetical protein
VAISRPITWQADLLDPELLSTSRRRPPSLLLPVAVLVVVLAALGAFTLAQLRAVGELRKRADAAKARIEQFDGQSGAQAAHLAIEQTRVSIEAQLARKRALLASLRDAVTGGHDDWTAAAVLTLLSRRYRDDLWLNRIVIDREHHGLRLEGQVESAASLSSWVAELGAGKGPLTGMAVLALSTGSDGAAAATDGTPPRGRRFTLEAKVGP